MIDNAQVHHALAKSAVPDFVARAAGRLLEAADGLRLLLRFDDGCHGGSFAGMRR